VKCYFLDTSSIVRLYTVEPGWSVVRNLLRGATLDPPTTRICYCDLALPETVSALVRIASESDGARRGVSRASNQRTLPQIRTGLMTAPAAAVMASTCMSLASEVVERRRVRGADAVHIAAALTARKTFGEALSFTFVSADHQQCQAAEREGLDVLVLAA
jgi:predicted nucleic acid-binding protein